MDSEERSTAPAAKPTCRGTAKAAVLALTQRPGGATLDEIVAAIGWQKRRRAWS